ncbi:MAG: hypothetical protein B0W54_14105 [Cellvibrio sp. 79]|nr:MAG: hypothetical protein B0W54_14105 [Cellvibrio sp. 79]
MTVLNFAIPAWQSWSGEQPDAAQIPAMLRRRLSMLGRAAFSVIEPLVARYGPMPLVYVSRHGECSRTLGLLQDLANGELISPTAFGLSVHNSTAGLYSIHRGLTTGITALSGGPHNLLAGLLEALGIARQTDGQVLCVFSDEPPPPIYHLHVNQPSQPFALAIVVAAGSGWQLQPESRVDALEAPVMSLVDLMESAQADLLLGSVGQVWRLSRTTP